jgi:hypothetical protein
MGQYLSKVKLGAHGSKITGAGAHDGNRFAVQRLLGGRDAQSRAFSIAPLMELLYSGVAMSSGIRHGNPLPEIIHWLGKWFFMVGVEGWQGGQVENFHTHASGQHFHGSMQQRRLYDPGAGCRRFQECGWVLVFP